MIAFDPAVEAARRHAQLAGHLLEGSTRIDFQQGEHPSKEGRIASQN
jgi:hypothetical protein